MRVLFCMFFMVKAPFSTMVQKQLKGDLLVHGEILSIDISLTNLI